MAKRSILFLAVVASLISISAFATWNDYYYSFGHQYLAADSSSGVQNSMFNGSAAGVGLYTDALGNDIGGNDYLSVSANPNDDTFTQPFQIQKGGFPLALGGFSYNLFGNAGHISITDWLANNQKTLLYSIAQNYQLNPNVANEYGLKRTVIMLTNGSDSTGSGTHVQYGSEGIIKHMDILVTTPTFMKPLLPNTLGVQVNDHTLGLQAIVKDGSGNEQANTGLAIADFILTTDQPASDARIYFSASNHATFQLFATQYNLIRPDVAWKGGSGTTAYAGSAYNGNASAGDILTANYDAGQFGIFEYAWKLAGYMVGDQFWTSGLVWNNYNGYVATSTASTAAKAAGHDAVQNFIRYALAISGVKVEDANGNGKFDAATDKVLFTLDPATIAISKAEAWDPSKSWTDPNVDKLGYGFSSDAIYLYDANGVTTYMDASSNLFFGQNQTTGNATIWGGKYGRYDITGFDLATYIPEPSTMILIIGTGLALGAGILRKRMH